MSASLLVLCAAHLGCYDWIDIKPTELPKLTESSARRIEGPAGEVVEVRRAYDVRITSLTGTANYSSPVRSSLSDGTLTVDGPGQTRQSFFICGSRRGSKFHSSILRARASLSSLACSAWR